MLDFNALKKSSSASLETLVQEAEKLTKREDRGPDERFWTPAVDKAGNGYAVIRFLPPSQGEDLPWVRIYDHGFQGPGGWYIENSLTTIGLDDPASEYNQMLWNSGIAANKDIVSKGLPGFKGSLKRRMKYIANILVIQDKANPANEGKVFLYRFGPKIFGKLQEAMKPQFEDEQPINPFDFWNGADFKLKIRQVEGYQNYDKSEFDKPSAIAVKDDDIKAIWEKQYPLKAFLDASNFKTYEELKRRHDRVMGTSTQATIRSQEAASPDVGKTAERPVMKEASTPWENTDGDDDDSLSYFKKLAEE